MYAGAHCNICNTRHQTKDPITMEQVKLYEDGALVQDAFPFHSIDDREILISALRTKFFLCPDCWDDIEET